MQPHLLRNRTMGCTCLKGPRVLGCSLCRRHQPCIRLASLAASLIHTIILEGYVCTILV